MQHRKLKTLIYKGLGIPVRLINVPMKKAAGEWCIDIDMNQLMLLVLREVISKPTSLTRDELRYIRTYLEMTAAEFGVVFGVPSSLVVKWEKGRSKIPPAVELYMRLYVLNHLEAKDKEFRDLYNDISLQRLSSHSRGRSLPITVNAATEELKIA